MNILNKSVRRRTKGMRNKQFTGNICPCSPDVGDCPRCHPVSEIPLTAQPKQKKTRKRKLV